MALMKIREPGAGARAVGIDLGTTHSLVAVMEAERGRVIAGRDAQPLLPSVARLRDDGALQVGREAMGGADALASVKRFMGVAFGDMDAAVAAARGVEADAGGGAVFVTSTGRVTPIEVSAAILAELKRRAEEDLKAPVDAAVITVPAYFNEAQRRATADAARLAGLKTLRLLNEPTAAALGYQLDESDGRLVAVYDLGGGTFDISILKLDGRVFEVLATGGDTALGGDDFDQALAEDFAAACGLDFDGLDVGRHRELMRAARAAREASSEADGVEMRWEDHRREYHRDDIDGVCAPWLERSLRICRRCLKDAKLAAADIDEVALVGGATRMPMVRRAVRDLFGREPHAEVDPDKVVALGAARQAALLSGERPDDDTLLLDVTPLSLGLETLGGLVERVIPRNTPIPARRAREFTTAKDGQSGLSLHVLQGERDLAADCQSLAKFELLNIPPLAAGAARIEVVFEIDADGLLRVRAEEKSAGVAADVEVRPAVGLPEARIAEMLEEAFLHAETDAEARALREVVTEAEQLIEALDKALADDGARLLDETESAALKRDMRALASAARGGDAAKIRELTQTLEATSAPLVERRMDDLIQRALVGRSLGEVESK